VCVWCVVRVFVVCGFLHVCLVFVCDVCLLRACAVWCGCFLVCVLCVVCVVFVCVCVMCLTGWLCAWCVLCGELLCVVCA